MTVMNMVNFISVTLFHHKTYLEYFYSGEKGFNKVLTPWFSVPHAFLSSPLEHHRPLTSYFCLLSPISTGPLLSWDCIPRASVSQQTSASPPALGTSPFPVSTSADDVTSISPFWFLVFRERSGTSTRRKQHALGKQVVESGVFALWQDGSWFASL